MPNVRFTGPARESSWRRVATGMWGRDEAETARRLEAWNQPIHRVRGRIEKIFGTWKRSYGLRRMRWRGLAKAGLQIRLTAIAYNLNSDKHIIRTVRRKMFLQQVAEDFSWLYVLKVYKDLFT